MRLLKLILLSTCLLGFRTDPFFSFEKFKNGSVLELHCNVHEEEYDCGEWGGHEEHFVVSKTNGIISLSFKRDSSDCYRLDFIKPKGFPKMVSAEIVLNKHKQRIVENYINKLLKHTPSEYIRTNAPGSYTIKYKGEEMEIFDSDNSWEKRHERFKKKLL
jgi:hypothetical protein